MKEFRELRADEIDVRVQSVQKGKSVGVILLLYKDARCDMNILDETLGITNWQRSHELIDNKLFCNVSIYDDEKGMWVTKQDVGTESITESEKGQASDAFKRACFNWGIGRELYTTPFTYAQLADDEFSDEKGKLKLKKGIKFRVAEIEYKNRKICKLRIIDNKGNYRFSYGYK